MTRATPPRRITSAFPPVLALPASVLMAMTAGAILPENPRAPPAADGITIHIDSSLVHTWLILPVAAAGHDWRHRLPAFPSGRPPGPFLAFGWGERNFLLATPRWADLDPGLALRALFAGHATLVHIDRLDAPAGRPIRLSAAQYRRLVAHLDAQLAPGAPLPGYGPDGLFLPAHGRYSPWRTCNQWTRDALAAAGVRVGRWTPLPQGLMWRFDRVEGETG